MDFVQNLYVDSTYLGKLNGIKIRFIAPSELKLLTIKAITRI